MRTQFEDRVLKQFYIVDILYTQFCCISCSTFSQFTHNTLCTQTTRCKHYMHIACTTIASFPRPSHCQYLTANTSGGNGLGMRLSYRVSSPIFYQRKKTFTAARLVSVQDPTTPSPRSLQYRTWGIALYYMYIIPPKLKDKIWDGD